MATTYWIAAVLFGVGGAWLVNKVGYLNVRVERLERDVKHGLERLHAVEKQVYPHLSEDQGS
jgi:hypothetical protein